MADKKYQFVWITQIKDGKRIELGGLAWRGKEINYQVLRPEFLALSTSVLVMDSLQNRNPQDAVEYLMKSANGINWDVSQPIIVESPYIESVISLAR